MYVDTAFEKEKSPSKANYIQFCILDEEIQDVQEGEVIPPTRYTFALIPTDRINYLGWFHSISPVSGYGYSFNKDGSYYHGEFLNDEKNGKGKFYYDNGSHYDGTWHKNAKQGNGRFYFNKDLYYRGQWDNNRMLNCELQYTHSLCSDIQYVYSFISSRNDYIFFRQAQISTFNSCF